MQVSLEGALDGDENMKRDWALMERAELGESGARIYTWDRPWLSLGRFQRIWDVQREMGELPCAVRPTGGKAVRHGEDLTVAVAVPLSALGLSNRQVKVAYRALAAPLVAGLRASGRCAILAEGSRWCKPPERTDRTTDCFAHASPNDIVDEQTGEKVCGCALRLTERAVLLQASIPAPSIGTMNKVRDGIEAALLEFGRTLRQLARRS